MGADVSDPRKPPRAGADYTAREVTRPGTGRHPRLTVDELADTRDESTPVRDLVADMEAARETLGSLVADDLRRSELWDLPSTQWARRIVDDIAALKAAADRSRDTDRDRADFVERLAVVEADLRHHREYQLKLSGVADGNGRLGAMVFGGTAEDRIQFNEATLWVGEPRDYSRPGAANHLAAIRPRGFVINLKPEA